MAFFARKLLLSVVGFSVLACGGGAPPPKDLPPINTVRPTVEKTPPPATPQR